MNFKSVKEEQTRIEASNVRGKLLQSKSDQVISQLDPFLLQDFYLATEGEYRLEIQDNLDGETVTYSLNDALINIDALVSNMLLPLKLEVELNGNRDTLHFNISMTEANTSHGSLESPKYYIYCDDSENISFRFWFKKIS
jgi:hypothetical protein